MIMKYLKLIKAYSVQKDVRWKPPELLTPYSVCHCITISSHVLPTCEQQSITIISGLTGTPRIRIHPNTARAQHKRFSGSMIKVEKRVSRGMTMPEMGEPHERSLEAATQLLRSERRADSGVGCLVSRYSHWSST